MFQPLRYEYDDSNVLWPQKKHLHAFWDDSGKDMIQELVQGFTSQLEAVIDGTSTDVQDHITLITRALSNADTHFQQFKEQNQMDEDFVK